MGGMSMLLKQFSNLSRRQKLARLRFIAQKAMDHYHIEVSDLRFYAEHSNALFSVVAADGRKYLLKVTRPGDHSYEETLAALEWLRFVNAAVQVHIIRVVPTRDGSVAVTVEAEGVPEPRFCSLFEWIPGRNLEARLTGVTARMWGELSASIHTVSRDYSSPHNNSLMRWDKVFYWDEEVLFSGAHDRFLPVERKAIYQQAVDWVQAAIDKQHSSSPPMLIHGDLHPENVKVNGKELWALDVEDLMWGHPLQDIAISLFYVRRRDDYPRLYDAFKDGYSTVAEWPVQDEAELWAHFAGRQLMFANYLVKLSDFGEEETHAALSNYEAAFAESLERWT